MTIARGLLFTISLVAVVGLIGSFELHAGQHAQLGVLAWAVPLVLGPYVLWTWTDPQVSRGDELLAVALLLGSVSLSVAVSGRTVEQKWTALAIGVVVILVDWRIVVRWRESRVHGAELAAVTAELAAVRERARAQLNDESAARSRAELAAARAAADAEDARRAAAEAEQRAADEVAAVRREAAAAVAAASAASGGERTASGGERPAAGGVWTAGPPWGNTLADQVAWLRETIADGLDLTGGEVAALMGLGSAKTGRDRLAEARRPHAVAAAS